MGEGLNALQPGTSYQVRVAVVLGAGGSWLPWSTPTPFHTQFTPITYQAQPRMWASNASAMFVMFRKTFAGAAQGTGKHVFLAISAKPSPSTTFPHGRNTSHLVRARVRCTPPLLRLSFLFAALCASPLCADACPLVLMLADAHAA